jgi:hypothetical protein
MHGPLEGEIAVVVGDDINGHRILFGYATKWDMKSGIVLRRARCAVRYSAANFGELGLAVVGPGDGCRITPSVEFLVLSGQLTYVARCTTEAVIRWEMGQWT